jgi:hypothetical protein
MLYFNVMHPVGRAVAVVASFAFHADSMKFQHKVYWL